MKILGVIPARYASTRFPAKPLADMDGKSMIQRVYLQALKSKKLTDVVVATDHQEIFSHVNTFGGAVMMTSEFHISGTDRCFEALTKHTGSFDYVINIQGDEPFIAPEQIDLLASLLDSHTQIATLAKKIDAEDQLFNPNVVKVIFGKNKEAIYFSRSTIPYLRNFDPSKWLQTGTIYKHIGMYAYRTDILEKITQLEATMLERAESLEQLRWLESGFPIKVAETSIETIGIDTPEDLTKALDYLKKK